jgi:hypothetical protein
LQKPAILIYILAHTYLFGFNTEEEYVYSRATTAATSSGQKETASQGGRRTAGAKAQREATFRDKERCIFIK